MVKAFSLAIILCVYFSCSKDSEICYLNSCIDWEEYSSHSLLNYSVGWNAQYAWFGNANVDSTFTFNFQITNEFLELRESITITDIDLTLDTIVLFPNTRILEENHGKPSARYSTFVADGDAITSLYRLNSDSLSYIAISTIDKDTLEISGAFELHFLVDVGADLPLPDTLNFTGGMFAAGKLVQ